MFVNKHLSEMEVQLAKIEGNVSDTTMYVHTLCVCVCVRACVHACVYVHVCGVCFTHTCIPHRVYC